MLKKTICLATACLLAISPLQLDARVRFCTGRFYTCNDKTQAQASQHFKKGLEFYKARRFALAARHLKFLTRDYHPSSYPREAYYYLGFSFYHLNELDLANATWNIYIQEEAEPSLLEDVMQAKLDIANRCHQGARGRLFGCRPFPKWSSGENLAMEIYDEIIATTPTSDLAASALIDRARLFCKQSAYQEAIDSLYLMVRRFPQHELAPVSYLTMQEVYLAWARADGQNPDTLSLAETALDRFAGSFPKDERLSQAKCLFATIRDVQAFSFYKTALFYKRLKFPQAAIMYCKATIRQFPDTPTAERCKTLLTCLDPDWQENALNTANPTDLPGDLPDPEEELNTNENISDEG